MYLRGHCWCCLPAHVMLQCGKPSCPSLCTDFYRGQSIHHRRNKGMYPWVMRYGRAAHISVSTLDTSVKPSRSICIYRFMLWSRRDCRNNVVFIVWTQSVALPWFYARDFMSKMSNATRPKGCVIETFQYRQWLSQSVAKQMWAMNSTDWACTWAFAKR